MMIPEAIMQMLRQRAGSNKTMDNALNMMERGDYAGVENIAKNLCKERGINPDDVLKDVQKNIQGMFRFK